jgi:hypothetical protein
MFDLYELNYEQLLGKPTLHLPINLIVQEADEKTGKFWGIWQAQHPNLHKIKFGSSAVHQLVIADCFLRPQLVFESNEFKGYGLAGLATNAFQATEKWNGIFQR